MAESEFCARFNAEARKGHEACRTLIVVNGEMGERGCACGGRGGKLACAIPGPSFAEANTHRNEDGRSGCTSSGSTGRPKGIVHLQHDMTYSEVAFAQNVLKLDA
ncbi:hypothetical protein BRDID11002_15280 [Bradyrhizobium diazoefficiens]